LPYVDSTQSGVIQLAYGFEKPVITTDVGGLAEVVKDGETGIIVPPADNLALSQALIRFFEARLSSTFRVNIRARAPTFAWERLVTLLETIFRTQSLLPRPDTVGE
jgi:glycosyltransferase involved in cell wall biosynthesis